MGLRGVNRIMVAVRDMDRAKQQYAALLGATFVPADWTGEPFGIAVAIAWDAGIELCAPLPGREHDSAVSAFLEHRGEGIMCVFFGVDDADAARDRASDHGYRTVGSIDYTPAEIDQHLGGLFNRYLEHTLDSAGRCGFTVALAQLDEAQGSA